MACDVKKTNSIEIVLKGFGCFWYIFAKRSVV